MHEVDRLRTENVTLRSKVEAITTEWQHTKKLLATAIESLSGCSGEEWDALEEERDRLRAELVDAIASRDTFARRLETASEQLAEVTRERGTLRDALEEQLDLWEMARPLVEAGDNPMHVPFLQLHRPVDMILKALGVET